MATNNTIPLGDHRKHNGIDRAESGADTSWKDEAEKIVEFLAERNATFTTDDVWRLLAETKAETHEHRAMGAVMRAAARNGIIEKTDRVVPTLRACANRRPVAVWSSLVFGEQGKAAS